MSYTLEQFITDCRKALSEDSGPGGREVVRGLVAKACNDSDFVSTHLGASADAERDILYRDPDMGFCILAHVYKGAKTSAPHDHGPSWAIYGQAVGTTEMTDWRKLEAPSGDKPGKVEAVRTYRLEPGDAYVYNEGDLHSPHRTGETRLLRIEGTDMTQVRRDQYQAA